MTIKQPLPAPPLDELLATMGADRVLSLMLGDTQGPDVSGRYRHWDSLRQLEPPEGMSSEEWWVAVKLTRQRAGRALPAMSDREGEPWRLVLAGPVLARLHQIDRFASGQLAASEVVTSLENSRRYLVDSLIEEAITSSQLEGASTTRRVARDLLRTGRAPATRSERMIVNNYRAMQFVSEHRDEELSVAMLQTIHRIVVDATLDPEDADAAGRFQRPDEERVVVENQRGEILHRPVDAALLPARMEQLCAFANGFPDGTDTFLHPVVRAVMLHFWIGYDHPFVDGNGRTARAVFYWSMLRQGYWLTEYLSISNILRAGPAKYARSYLYTEIDDNDFTYFLLHQLETISRAIESLRAWLGRKTEEIRDIEAVVRGADLNRRQVALLGHVLRHDHASYTFKGHARSHDVAVGTARNDLLGLVDRGLLEQSKRGRQHVFRAVADVADRVRSLD